MARAELDGIGGWLILIAISLGITPLSLARNIFHTDLPAALGVGTAGLHFAGFYLLVRNLVSLTGLIILNVLFYRRRRIFPVGMMTYYGWIVIAGLIQLAVYATSGLHDGIVRARGNIVFVLIGAAIWVPYLLLSRRVKATFTR